MASDHASPSALSAVAGPDSRCGTLVAAGVIGLAALAVYANSLSCPFVFDDLPAIVDNSTIRHLGRIGEVLSPAANGAGSAGRPQPLFVTKAETRACSHYRRASMMNAK